MRTTSHAITAVKPMTGPAEPGRYFEHGPFVKIFTMGHTEPIQFLNTETLTCACRCDSETPADPVPVGGYLSRLNLCKAPLIHPSAC